MGANIHSYTHTLLEKITYTWLWHSATLECPSLHSLQSSLSTKHGQVWRELLSLEFPYFRWFLLGVSLGRKMKKRFMKESYHILNITQCQIKKNHQWIFYCVDTYRHHDYHDFVLLYTWISMSTWHFLIPLFTRVKNALLVKQLSECPCSGSERHCSGFLSKA